MPAQAFGVLLLLMVAFADLSMSNPTVDYDHDNVIDIGDDDGPPECTTNISKVSFSCCFHNVDIRGNYSECYNSDEGNEGCHAGNDWTVNEDSCKDVDLTSKLETPDIAECWGQTVEDDPSTNFTWACDKPPPPDATAIVSIEPEVGETHVPMFNLTISTEKAFPQPYISINLHMDGSKFDDAEIIDHKSDVNQGLDGYYNGKDYYRLKIKAAKANLEIVVKQGLLTDPQKINYTIDYPEYNGGDEGSGAPSIVPMFAGYFLFFFMIAFLL